MDKLTNKYVSYFTDANEMIGKPAAQSILFLLYSIYKQKQNPNLELSNEYIHQKTHVGVNAVAEQLKFLQRIGIISYTSKSKVGNSILLNIDRFKSLMAAFIPLSDKDRKTFSNALQSDSHENVIKALGYKFCSQLQDPAAEKDSLNGYSHETVRIDTALSRNSENNTHNCHDSVRINSSFSRFSENSWQLLLEYIGKNTILETILAHKDEFFTENLEDYEIEEQIESFILTESCVYSHETVRNVSRNSENTHIYIEKEKIEKNKGSEAPYIKGKKHSDFLKLSEEDLNIIEDLPDYFEKESDDERIAARHERAQRRARESQLVKTRPIYFSPDEAKNFMNDIYLCTESPVKMFLNCFWTLIVEEEERKLSDKAEREGAELQPEEITLPIDWNPEGELYTSEEYSQYISRAMDWLVDIAEKGVVDVTDEEIPVSFSIEEVQALNSGTDIVKWDREVLPEGIFYKVSWEQYVDVEATNKRPKFIKKSSRKENIQYLYDLWLQESISQLSPLEQTIATFIKRWFVYESKWDLKFKTYADGMLVPEMRVKKQFITNHDDYIQYFGDVTYKDFATVQDDERACEIWQTSDLVLSGEMFSMSKIKDWNAQHGY